MPRQTESPHARGTIRNEQSHGPRAMRRFLGHTREHRCDKVLIHEARYTRDLPQIRIARNANGSPFLSPTCVETGRR